MVFTKKHVLVKKMFTNELNILLPQRAGVKKTIHGVKTLWFTSKEKVPNTMVSKECHTERLLLHERTHPY